MTAHFHRAFRNKVDLTAGILLMMVSLEILFCGTHKPCECQSQTWKYGSAHAFQSQIQSLILPFFLPISTFTFLFLTSLLFLSAFFLLFYLFSPSSYLPGSPFFVASLAISFPKNLPSFPASSLYSMTFS